MRFVLGLMLIYVILIGLMILAFKTKHKKTGTALAIFLIVLTILLIKSYIALEEFGKHVNNWFHSLSDMPTIY